MDSLKPFEIEFLSMVFPDPGARIWVSNEEKIREYADFHKVSGHIHHLINTKRLHLENSPSLKKYFEDEYNKNLFHNSMKLEFIRELKKEFPSLEVFKGALLLDTLYKDRKGSRFISDIDILLKPDILKEVYCYLEERGFNPLVPYEKTDKKQRSHITLRGEWKKVFFQVELHWRIFEIETGDSSDFLRLPGSLATVHLVYHYYLHRLYHMVEWGQMRNAGMMGEREKDHLNSIGMSRELEHIEALYERLLEHKIDDPIMRKFFSLLRPPNFFERFFFWFFYQKRMKRKFSYLMRRIKRGIRW